MSDGGSPPQTDVTVVRVSVDRNLNKPVFDPNTYQVKVKETQTLGETIATVRALDDDMRVCENHSVEISNWFSD